MIKAIMLDVDGTLVSFETHKILQSSVEALKEIHDRGIRIVIATGRAAGDLHEIAAVPYDGIIALNGADCVLLDGAHSHQITFQTFYPKFLVTSMHAVGKDTDIIRSVPFRQRV